MPEDTIRILGLEDDGDRNNRLSLKRPQEWRLGRVDVPISEFQDRVTEFVASMHKIIAGLHVNADGYQLDEVTVCAEVSAKGTISLLGSGGELSGKTGFTFTFSLRHANADGPR